jgi:large conductance mechanosensitive channel
VLKGFKDFILRGNVVDLAVAVVVGAAFTAIVTAFTKSLIEPLINAVTPPTSPGLGIQLVEGKWERRTPTSTSRPSSPPRSTS